MNDEDKLKYVIDHIGVFPDFPKKGVVFRDIFTALRDGCCCKFIKDLILGHVKNSCPDIDIVLGLESRGFLFSFLIASELGIGNAVVRKRGKLPGECFQQEYSLEYGMDVFEMQKASINPGQKVLIIDDLLATGGSLESAIKLVQQAGGFVQEAFVIIELPELEGRRKLDCTVHSLIKY